MDSSGLAAVVTLEVSFEIVVLSEPLPTHLAREPVLAVVRTVEELVVPQLVFPSEKFITGLSHVRDISWFLSSCSLLYGILFLGIVDLLIVYYYIKLSFI